MKIKALGAAKMSLNDISTDTNFPAQIQPKMKLRREPRFYDYLILME